MRVSSLAALAIVVALTVYFVFLTPDWVVDLYLKATGYGPASTPTEAVDRFLKSVQKRDLTTAAKFCTGPYADQLKRGAAATGELGPLLDSINEYMKNKGLDTDKCITYLNWLDPFPTNIKMNGAPKEIDANNAKGFFAEESILKNPDLLSRSAIEADVRSFDARMYDKALMPNNLLSPKGIAIVQDGGSWKLKFPLPDSQVQLIDYYLNHYKAYVTGLTEFRRNVTNDRFPSKQDFERELVSVLQKSK